MHVQDSCWPLLRPFRMLKVLPLTEPIMGI